MNFDELKAKGKNLDYIDGYLQGQSDRLDEEIALVKKRIKNEIKIETQIKGNKSNILSK